MSAVRVILITVAGPGGHVDVGIRSDATPADLADALGGVIGVGQATLVIEHRSPPRPGVPEGGRVLVQPGTALAEVGVADGDLVLFRPAGGAAGFSWPEVQARPAEFGASSPPMDAPLSPQQAPDPGSSPRYVPDPSAPAASAPPAAAEPVTPAAPWSAAEPVTPAAPWSGRSGAGRHARNRTDLADPQPDQAGDSTEQWPAAATEAGEQDQPWRQDSQEVNSDDWPG
jgi:hypothetical protein